MKKRFLSGLLLLVMLFSLAPVKVYAAEAPPDISTPDGTPKADDTEPPYGGLPRFGNSWLEARFIRSGYIEMARDDTWVRNDIETGNQMHPGTYPEFENLRIWYRFYQDSAPAELSPDKDIVEADGWQLFDKPTAILQYKVNQVGSVLFAITNAANNPKRPIAYYDNDVRGIVGMGESPNTPVTAFLQEDGSIKLTFVDSCKEIYYKLLNETPDNILLDPHKDYEENPDDWTKGEIPDGVISGQPYDVIVANPDNKTHIAFVQTETTAKPNYKTDVVEIVDPTLLTIERLGTDSAYNQVYCTPMGGIDKVQDKTKDYEVLTLAPKGAPKPVLPEGWHIGVVSQEEVYDFWQLTEVPEVERFVIPDDCEDQYLVLLTISPEQTVKKIQITDGPITRNPGHAEVKLSVPGDSTFKPVTLGIFDFSDDDRDEKWEVYVGKGAKSLQVDATYDSSEITEMSLGAYSMDTETELPVTGGNGHWTIQLDQVNPSQKYGIKLQATVRKGKESIVGEHYVARVYQKVRPYVAVQIADDEAFDTVVERGVILKYPTNFDTYAGKPFKFRVKYDGPYQIIHYTVTDGVRHKVGESTSADNPMILHAGTNEFNIFLGIDESNGIYGADGLYTVQVFAGTQQYKWTAFIDPSAAEHMEIVGRDNYENEAHETATFEFLVDKGWTPTISDDRFTLWAPEVTPDVPDGKLKWKVDVKAAENLDLRFGVQKGQQYTVRTFLDCEASSVDFAEPHPPLAADRLLSERVSEGDDYTLALSLAYDLIPIFTNDYEVGAEFTLIPKLMHLYDIDGVGNTRWECTLPNVQRSYELNVRWDYVERIGSKPVNFVSAYYDGQLMKVVDGEERYPLSHYFVAKEGYPVQITLDVLEGYRPVVLSAEGANGSFTQRDGTTLWDYQVDCVNEEITLKLSTEKYAGAEVTAKLTGTETRLSLPDGGKFPLTKTIALGSAYELAVVAEAGYQPAVQRAEGIEAAQVTFRQGTEPNTWICRIEEVTGPITLTLKSVPFEQTGITLDVKEGEDKITLPDGGSFPLTVPAVDGEPYTISVRVEEGYIPAVYHAEGVASTSVFFTQDEADKTLWSYTLKSVDRRIALTLCALESPKATVSIDVAADAQDYITGVEPDSITVEKGADAEFSFLAEEGWLPNTDDSSVYLEMDGEPDENGQTQWTGTIPAVKQDMTVTLTAEEAPREPDLIAPPAEVDEDGKAATEVIVEGAETDEEIKDAVQEIIDDMEDDTFVTGTTETAPGSDAPEAAEITIPSAVVETVAEAKNIALEIGTPVGTIRIPAELVSVIAPPDANKIILEIGPNKEAASDEEKDLFEAFDIDFKKVTEDEEKEVIPVDEGVGLDVSVKTDLKPTTGKGLLAFLIEEAQNTAKQVRTVVQRGIMPRNGFASFRVPHLSIYALCDAPNAGRLGLPDGISIDVTAGSDSYELETSDFKGVDNSYTIPGTVTAGSIQVKVGGTDDAVAVWNATTAQDSENGAVSLQNGENIIGIRIEGIEYQLIVTRKSGSTPSVTPPDNNNTDTDNDSDNDSSSDRTGGGASSKYKPIFSTNEVPTPNTPETANQGWRAPSYYDVPAGEWYYNAVMFVSREGMMAGNNGYFSPNDRLTRGMMAQILYNLEKTPGSTVSTFPDVAASDWFSDAAAWAASFGCMSGYSDGRFGPLDSITREQLAAILYRYAGAKGYHTAASAEISGFADGNTVSDWAASSMRWAVATGILSGKSGSRLDPAGHATRAEVAQILMNFYTNFAA